MSEFVCHEPCPKCGSKDNLARYSDGGTHCFGCGYHPKVTKSPYIYELTNSRKQRSPTGLGILEDELSSDAVKWASSYGVWVEELMHHRCGGSPKEPWRLYFRWFDSSGSCILGQARDLTKNPKRKYITYGTPNEVLPIYYHRGESRRTDRLVIVEDALSAIKISRISDSMPCLGSDLPPIKLKRLAGLYRAFTVWLDSNMYDKAQRMARRLQLLGCEAHAVWTELDPKCYSTEEILRALTSSNNPGTIEVVDFSKT